MAVQKNKLINLIPKIVFLQLILFCSPKLWSQERTYIAGMVPQFAGQKLNLQFNSTPFQNNLNQLEITVGQDGLFHNNISVMEDQVVNLFLGSDILRFHIKPADSLYIVITHRDGKRAQQFFGKGASDAAWFERQKQQFANSFEGADFPNKLLTEMGLRKADQFKLFLDSITLTKTDFLMKNSKGLTPGFVNWQTAEIKYEYETFKLNYPTWYYSMRGIENKTLQVDSNFYNFLNKDQINHPEYLGSAQYRNFLKYYFMYQMRKNKLQFNAVEMYNYTSNFFNGKVLKNVRLHLWSDIMQYGQVNESMALHPIVLKELANEPGFDKLEKIYAEKLPFEPGSVAFPFTLKTIDGNEVALKDFIGKVVYIDFWASWCGPCKREIPSGEELKKHFAGKDVIFLNISIDEDESKWKAAVKNYQLSGINLISNSNNNPDVLRDYKVASIPTYFLIGKDGKFISAPAVRPSNNIIYQMIEDGLRK